MQTFVPAEPWYLPAGQLVHTVAPLTAIFPAGQVVHSDAPLLADIFPVGHVVQTLSAVSEYEPGRQV